MQTVGAAVRVGRLVFHLGLVDDLATARSLVTVSVARVDLVPALMWQASRGDGIEHSLALLRGKRHGDAVLSG